ncbi:MAG: mechanosensitive ion channel domain-containing protein [Candidatus Hodarchaeota archaeon]
MQELPPIDLFGWKIPVMGLVIVVCSIVGMIIIYLVITKMLNKRVKLQGMPPDLFNGLRFLFKIIIGIIIMVIIFVYLEIETEYVLLINGLVVTAIAFASIKALNNFIAGIWITLTRPFSVGDYVKISGKEGIVVGISLNYTRIRHKTGNVTYLPNVDCISSKIINYTISTRWFRKQINQVKDSMERNQKILQKKKKTDKRREKIIKRLDQDLSEMREVLGEAARVCRALRRKEQKEQKEGLRHSTYARKRKIVRYTFTLPLPRDPRRNARILDEICKKWTEEFELVPEWKMVGISYHLDYQFVIMTPDPEDVTQYYDDFVTDVYKQIYKKS